MTTTEQIQNRLNYLENQFKKERTIAEIVAKVSNYVVNNIP